MIDLNNIQNGCGIYSITDTTDGRMYIGKAENFVVRLNQHLLALNGGRHQCRELQDAWSDHASAFNFCVVEQCDKDQLASHERYWIDTYSKSIRLFNSPAGGAGSPNRFRLHDAHAEYIGFRASGEMRKAIEQVCRSRKIVMSAFMREAMELHLELHRKQALAS